MRNALDHKVLPRMRRVSPPEDGQDLEAGDSYGEEGRMVFIEGDPTRPGHCCHRGCRHGPCNGVNVPPRTPGGTGVRALAVFLVLLGVGSGARAAPGLELFVKNRPFTGETRTTRFGLAAPLDDLFEALGCSWTLVEDRMMVTSQREGGGKPLGEKRRVVFDGRVLRLPQYSLRGRVYVLVADLAAALGARYVVNRELGTADLHAPEGLRIPPGRVTTDGRTHDGSPLRLEALSYRLTPAEEGLPPRLRGYAVVRNTGTRPAREVLLRLQVVDPSGEVRGIFSRRFEVLAAGESVTWQFPVWTDYFGAGVVEPRLTIFHAP